MQMPMRVMDHLRSRYVSSSQLADNFDKTSVVLFVSSFEPLKRKIVIRPVHIVHLPLGSSNSLRMTAIRKAFRHLELPRLVATGYLPSKER